MARALTGLAPSARLTAVALVLAATVVTPACGDGPTTRPDEPGGPVSQVAVDEAVAALCSLLATDDPDAAERAFEDRAHDAIHAIADAVRDLDPALAGAVLEAKDPIETAVGAGEPPASYREEVLALLDALGAAVAELGLTSSSCGA